MDLMNITGFDDVLVFLHGDAAETYLAAERAKLEREEKERAERALASFRLAVSTDPSLFYT